MALSLALLVRSISAAGQDSRAQATHQLPAPTDIDPQLTEQLRRQEQNLADAILRKDAEALDRLVGPKYTLRLADVPQASMPRAISIANTLNVLFKGGSVDLRDCVARRLADDLAVVSLIHDQKATIDGRNFSGVFYVVDFWKKRDARWQIVARHSSPVGHKVDRGNRPLPPPADVGLELMAVLRTLEEQLVHAALGRFKDTATIERVVASEFTQRVADAPQRSLLRALWGQPSARYRKLADDSARASRSTASAYPRLGVDSVHRRWRQTAHFIWPTRMAR